MTTITYDEYFEIYDTSPSTNWENGKILLSYKKIFFVSSPHDLNSQEIPWSNLLKCFKNTLKISEKSRRKITILVYLLVRADDHRHKIRKKFVHL